MHHPHRRNRRRVDTRDPGRLGDQTAHLRLAVIAAEQEQQDQGTDHRRQQRRVESRAWRYSGDDRPVRRSRRASITSSRKSFVAMLGGANAEGSKQG
jgi:hypothetical protein